jgi:hypothetical protein
MKLIKSILILIFGLFIIFQNLYLYNIARKLTYENINLIQKIDKLQEELCREVGCIRIQAE